MRRLALALLLLALAAPAWAGVTFTAQETPSFGDTLCVSPKVTTSWTPPADGTLVFVSVFNTNTATPETVTLTGNGQTWDAVGSSITFHSTSSPATRLTLFRARLTSGSAGSLTATFAGGVTQTGCALSVVSVTGTDTSGTNGSGAVTNIVTRTANGDVGTATITLAAFGNANNGTYAVFALGGTNTALTVKSGWTGGTGRNYNSPASSLQAEWIVTNDTTPSATWSGTSDTGGIALEVVAASASTPVRHKVNNQ